MKNIDIVAAFELEINKIDDLINKPVTDDSLYWINQAIMKFVKLRFNRDFVHGTSYEQTSKRTEDLIRLYKKTTIDLKNSVGTMDPINPRPLDSRSGLIEGDFNTGKDDIIKPVVLIASGYDSQDINYPTDFMYPLSESVQIRNIKDADPYETAVFECTNDNFMYRITNSLTDFHYRNKKARPLMVRTDKGCTLYTDKKYKVAKYMLSYLRKPSTLDLENPHKEYADFPDHILHEIIKMAAQMYIENQSDQRYKTILNEVNTQE